MTLPEIELHRVNKLFGQYCEQRIPPHARGQVKMIYQIKGNKVILIESRPHYNDPTKWTKMTIAQFEYDVESIRWSLYGYSEKSRHLPCIKGRLKELIEVLDKDCSCMFRR